VTQPALLAAVRPPTHPLVDLRCCSCEDVDWPDADLVIADPPWSYDGISGGTKTDAGYRQAFNAHNHYHCASAPSIADHLRDLPASRLALWLTWPMLAEWTEATRSQDRWWAWGHPRSGGAWCKSSEGDAGHFGPGHHWSGCTEPVLIYTRDGSFTCRQEPVRNAWIEPPGEHSRKPAKWQAQWIRRWVPEGGLILDPYAGLGSVAEAVLLAGGGRRYLGTEIDPTRHAAALSLLAQVRP
jgi:N6-adenosine-specific RNA methylase IME4